MATLSDSVVKLLLLGPSSIGPSDARDEDLVRLWHTGVDGWKAAWLEHRDTLEAEGVKRNLPRLWANKYFGAHLETWKPGHPRVMR